MPDLCQIMLERMITTLPEGRFLLCAGAVNTHISSFWASVGTPGCSKVAHLVPAGARWVLKLLPWMARVAQLVPSRAHRVL